MLNDALPLAVEADKVAAAARKEKRALTPTEQALVDKVAAMANEIIQVRVFVYSCICIDICMILILILTLRF
jgi:hypothetical protein